MRSFKRFMCFFLLVCFTATGTLSFAQQHAAEQSHIHTAIQGTEYKDKEPAIDTVVELHDHAGDDCSVCHFTCNAFFLPVNTVFTGIVSSEKDNPLADHPLFSSERIERIERPNWQPA